jgi:hypothetical protein
LAIKVFVCPGHADSENTDMKFKDHFSEHASVYAKYRPSYPAAMFRWLAEKSPDRHCAWDSATGNGQAAIGLAQWFDSVIASDASERQIADAQPHPSVTYRACPSEKTTLQDQSVDLVLTAQALHWLDVEAFYQEVRRVARPTALIAVCSYGLMRIDPRIDPIVDHFYGDTIVDYWPAERRHVDEGYADLPFPFDAIACPTFEMSRDWNLAELLGYISSWSAVGRFKKQCGNDPLPELSMALLSNWGDAGRRRTVSWPLHLRLGRVHTPS